MKGEHMQKIKTIDFVFYKTLGEKIRNAREKKDMTQTELAKMIGVSKSQLINYEYGYSKLKPRMYLDICRALNMRINDLFVDMKIDL